MKDYTTYIFDLDGTITDTLVVWLGIFRDCLETQGVVAPDDQALSKHTHDWRQMLQLGLPEDRLKAFIAQAHQLANQRLPKAPAQPRALDMLRALKQAGKHIAIFSTLDRPIFEPAMAFRKLNDIAEVAIAGTDVPHRKPAPDGILKALHDLGVTEENYKNCVYIGDKDSDIAAANNAGLDGALYYPSAHEPFYNLTDLLQHKPVHVIRDWRELYK